MPHLCERAPAACDRALHDRLLDDDRRDGRDERGGARLPPVAPGNAGPGVAEREHDGAHREVDLSRERDRRERERGPDEAPPLEREQGGGEEERDQSEQMPRRLADAVRRQGEDEPAGERRAAREAERAQPPAREPARGDEREQHDQVVGPDVPEERAERPEGNREQPALQVRRRRGLGPERVRVRPRRCALLELMAREPEGPAELEVVSGGGLAVAGCRPGQVAAAVEMADRGPGRPQRRGGVER